MKLIPNLADIDRKAVLQGGIAAETLMETAGSKVSDAVMRHANADGHGVILCGPGNNGGDGFVCARKLYQAGYRNLTVLYTGKQYRNEALANLEQLMLLPVSVIDARNQETAALQKIAQADFAVDALFGSGLSRPVENTEARLIAALNTERQGRGVWVLAVDLPSGIDGISGRIWGIAVEADCTVTLAAAKPGLYLFPGKAHAGMIELADIGIPPGFIDENESPVWLITHAMARGWLPARRPDSHKYNYGHALVIAGSRRMPGAAVLCAEAAMSAGAGLVTLAAPTAVFEQMRLMPELIRLPLPDADQLDPASIDALKAQLAQGRYASVAIGPGLGDAPETLEAVRNLVSLLADTDLPVIIDADGLNALAGHEIALNPRFILTPHVGECARLLETDKNVVAEDVLAAARKGRQRFNGASLVLKSAATVIAAGDRLDYITPTGNPGMATAGSGDVLTGVITAMAAQLHAAGLDIAAAGPLGVFLHGLAGDAATRKHTPYAMHAGAITRHLPDAFKELLQTSDRRVGAEQERPPHTNSKKSAY